jgi:hypothetical protein
MENKMNGKIRINPVTTSGIEPFEIEGEIKVKFTSEGIIFYANGASFPAEIVEVLEGNFPLVG